MKFILVFLFISYSALSHAEKSADSSITELTGNDVLFLTDDQGHNLLIPKIELITKDGRKTNSLGDNIFFGSKQKMLNAESNGYAGGSFDESTTYEIIDFSDGGVLDLRYKNNGLFISASLSCERKKIKLLENKEKADSFAKESALELYPARRIKQIYKFPDNRYLVVESPEKNVTPESFNFWIGTPGNMKRLETYYNTNYGDFKDFKESAGVSDKSGFNDSSGGFVPAKWIDGKTGSETVIERLIKYHPEIKKPSDLPIPSIKELNIPGFNYDSSINSICTYFKSKVTKQHIQ